MSMFYTIPRNCYNTIFFYLCPVTAQIRGSVPYHTLFMKNFLILLSLLLGLSVFTIGAQERDVYDINQGWKFFTYNERDSLAVNLPHTWNADALAGNKGYYRGIGNYLKYIEIKPQWRSRRIFMKFGGANSVTNLIINGRHVGQHEGGSNAFVFEITDYVDFAGRNLFWVAVNNGERIDVLPTAGEDNSYGGIFRDAELIITNTNIIGLDKYGSDGVFVRSTAVSGTKAEGNIGIRVNARVPKQLRLEVKITDGDGKVISENSLRPRVEKGISDHSVSFGVEDPVLWNGTRDPYLYDITVRLIDGKAVDSVTVKTGFRYFSVDPKTGFSLNGHPYPLKGVVLHRDRSTYGPVSLPGHIRQDIELIREMGANAVRVAGGAHSQEFYGMCDQIGLIVINDLPLTGSSTLERKGFYDTPGFRDNGKLQLREMLYQLYNHPSIVSWSLFTQPELRGDDPLPYIKELNTIAKTIDPGRLTVGTSTKDGEINTITDLIIFHQAFGWVEGRPEDIGVWADQIRDNPAWGKLKPGISYSCGGSVHQQQESLRRPRRNGSWHPEGWQTHFHEVYLKRLDGDTRFWALFAGDIFDYGSVRYTFGEGRGINDSGLVTFDRQTRKDAFYLYKANWNTEDPFVRIVGKRNNMLRSDRQTIKVYSNQEEVELFVNGKSIGKKQGQKGIFTWNNVIIRPGDNTITALSSLYSDTAVIRLAPREVMEQ